MMAPRRTPSTGSRSFPTTSRTSAPSCLPQDLPFPWNHEYGGGFSLDGKSRTRYDLKQATIPPAVIRFRAGRPDRLIDLSAFRSEQVKFSMLASRNVKFFIDP